MNDAREWMGVGVMLGLLLALAVVVVWQTLGPLRFSVTYLDDGAPADDHLYCHRKDGALQCASLEVFLGALRRAEDSSGAGPEDHPI